jgi:bla regulator protein BlaR1
MSDVEPGKMGASGFGRIRKFVVAFFLSFCASSGFGTTTTNLDFSEYFGGHRGCFVLYDKQTDNYLRYNSNACRERFSPCSTFKIANSLIALDTGVSTGPEFTLKWNGTTYPFASWNRDQNMSSAFSNSVIWYYQEIANRIGPVRMSNYVHRLNYGNCDTSGGITNFWLESTLEISAEEQLAFLRRLWENALPVGQHAQRVTRELMKISVDAEGRVLYGKTGTGGDARANVARLGWFVGCVEADGRRVFFATRITGAPDASGRLARQITEAILAKLKLWNSGSGG